MADKYYVVTQLARSSLNQLARSSLTEHMGLSEKLKSQEKGFLIISDPDPFAPMQASPPNVIGQSR